MEQLARFRQVFENRLLPQLEQRRGPWSIGPVFSGSRLVGGADADLIAAGLLLDLKTASKLTLDRASLFQLIGYALLDLDDEFGIESVVLFSGRYGYWTAWNLAQLLNELHGSTLSLPALRQEFRTMLREHVPPHPRRLA